MGHELQDRISLEIARRIAAELPQRSDWIELAHENLDRWSTRNSDSPSLLRAYSEWRTILRLPIRLICAKLTMQGEEGQRLRQSSPFVGALSDKTVREIKARARNEQNAA
jgi:hypothetical protein